MTVRSKARSRCDRSTAYLVFCLTAILVALTGGILLWFTDQDTLGQILLFTGDGAVIAGFVSYVKWAG